MKESIDLWVCPRCFVLQGIEVAIADGSMSGRCVNCGVPLAIDDVTFLDQNLAQAVIERTYDALPKFLHEDIRFSWVSNKTVGIIFEFPQEELLEETGSHVPEMLEDELSTELGITITLYFESG